MAREAEHQPILLRDISNALKIPHHFLSKVLQSLTRDGVIVSYKGANGGFALGRRAEDITLIDVVRAVDGATFLEQCVLGFPGCADTNPCPIHDSWKRSKGILLETLNTKNVDELSKTLDRKLELLEQLPKQ
jgi:Rrf2 family protein